MRRVATVLAGIGVTLSSVSWAADPMPLVLEAKIPLGNVRGRIDHLAVDLARQRLFVAELGNNSVGVVDLRERKVIQSITGLSEPQGVEYVPSADTLYASNAADGSVHLYQGSTLSPSGRIELGDDADNIRLDTQKDRVFVGYGSGALAVIDPASRRRIADIPLQAHPESFQFAEAETKIFVNVPDARQIAVIDASSGRQTSAISPPGARSNFPMAVDTDSHRVISIFRNPARLMAFGTQDGKLVANLATCGDADDVFVDNKRHRIYVSCGDGVIDVFERSGAQYQHIESIPTIPGARTSLFVPSTDRLYVPVRASLGEPAAIWVFRPTP